MKTKTPYAKPLLFLCFVLSTVFTGLNSLHAQILVQTSFEGSNPFAGFTTGQACCSYSVTAVSTVAHDGLQCFKSEVRNGDPAVSSGYRAEILPNNLDDEGDMWYGYSTRFEKMGGDGGHCIQWHPNNGSGSATLSIWTGENTFNVVRSLGNSTNYYQSSGGAWPVKSIVLNKWYDIVFHVKWSTGSDGIVEIWLDGAKYYDFRGQTMPTEGVYLKFGMNRWNVQNDWLVYYDNLKIGRNVTYADVAPASATAPSNIAPVARAGNDINIGLPTILASLDGSASSDPDGTIASYSWSRVSGPTTFSLLNPLSAITTLTSLIQGSYVFRLTVTDNKGASSTDDVTINVAGLLNSAPTVSAGSDISMTLPANTASLTGTANDADGSIATYAWTRVSGPTTYTMANGATSSASLTGLVQGTYVFKLTVTDNVGATSSDNISVVVNSAPNVAPTAAAGSDITLTLPTNSTTLSGGGTDSDGSISTYAWTRVSGPTTYTLVSPATAVSDLKGLVQGTYVFKLTVTDNKGATAADNITVTVNAVPNQAPTAGAGNDISITLPTNSTTLTGSGADADGSIASYSWNRVSGPTTYTFGNAGAASTSLSNLVVGTYVFRLTVTDNNGATASDNITVTVNAAPNQAPTADAGSDISITLPTNSTTLTGSGADADGSIASYSWNRVSGPTTFTFGNASAASTSLSNLGVGTYVFRLTVTDNKGATAADNLTVVVNPAPNQAPSADAGNSINITLPANSITLNGSGTDADGTIATYAWVKISGPTNFTIANDAAASTAVDNLEEGIYVFELTVTDNNGATATDNVSVTVNAITVPPNQLPTANAGNDMSITLPVNTVSVSGSGTDPDGTIVKYAWSRVSGPTNFTNAGANNPTFSLSSLVQGTYVFKLTVTDNSGATATDNMTLVVNAAPPPPPPVNQAPTARAGNDIVMTLPTNSTTLNGSGSTDADGTIATYTWRLVSGTGSYSIANVNAASTALTNLSQGSYVFMLTVTDNLGATATDNVSVTVNAAAPPPNQAPTASAGTAISITLPTNTVTLRGTGADADGTIASYAWTRVSGPTTFTVVNAAAASSAVNNLVQGVYVFQLTVTDNKGATASSNVTVTVNAAPPTHTNKAPNAKGGGNKKLILPATSTTLNATASTDVDGRIVSYQWTVLSGPTVAELSDPTAPIVDVSNLAMGEYACELKVVDNQGAISKDTVKISVETNDGEKIYVNIFPNPAVDKITLNYFQPITGAMKLIILDSKMTVVREERVTKDMVDLVKVIDISALRPGLYFLQIVKPDKRFIVRKFVKR